ASAALRNGRVDNGSCALWDRTSAPTPAGRSSNGVAVGRYDRNVIPEAPRRSPSRDFLGAPDRGIAVRAELLEASHPAARLAARTPGHGIFHSSATALSARRDSVGLFP